jgi:hypothetical protein
VSAEIIQFVPRSQRKPNGIFRLAVRTTAGLDDVVADYAAPRGLANMSRQAPKD